MAVVSPVSIEPSPPPAATTTGRRASAAKPAAIGAVGLVVLLVAMFGLRSMDALPRTLLAFVGIGGLWYGLQRLGQRRFGRDFSLGLWLSSAFITVVVLATLLADWLPVDPYTKTQVLLRRARPRLSFDEPLGRDANGASLLSRVLFAGRVSLTVAVLAVLVGLALGTLFGLLSGYFGGWVDGVINVFANATLAFPALILLMAVVAVFKPSVWSIGLALAAISIPTYTRIMRAQTLAITQREYVLAARSMGATSSRVMWREILPNAFLPVASYSFLVAANVIIAEGSLAFIGLSVPSPRPTWGGMVAEGQIKLKSDPHLVFVPATVMFLVVLSLNRIGDWARKRVMGERNLLS